MEDFDEEPEPLENPEPPEELEPSEDSGEEPEPLEVPDESEPLEDPGEEPEPLEDPEPLEEPEPLEDPESPEELEPVDAPDEEDSLKSQKSGNIKKLDTKEKHNENVDSEFRELMKEYSEKTNKKANHGLVFTEKFKEWIWDNLSINETEKQQLLEYTNYLNEILKRMVEGQILFSDKNITAICNDINEKFEISVTRKVVSRVAKMILSNKNYLERFSRGLLPEEIPEVIQKYKQGASSAELAKEYNVAVMTIFRRLKEYGVHSHGFGDLHKTKIIAPQEFTPDLAKFIALIMTEGYLNERGVSIKNTSFALIDTFKKLAKQNFQIENFSESIVKNDDPNRKRVYRCRISSVELARFLGSYIDKSDYQNATLPNEIFNLTEEDIGKVLQIAFSADGSVAFRPRIRSATNRWNITKQIELGCHSPSLIKQWRRLIESLGINCYINAGRIIISRLENILDFKEKIDFLEGIGIQKHTLWEDYTRREVLDALIESYKYPMVKGFDSKEEALEFLKSLFKPKEKRKCTL